MPNKKFRLIVVGDEILSGKRQDKHMAKMIELLTERGLSLSQVEYVGDDRAAITEVLKRSFATNDVVFSTGGIGSTPDDHTRQCAAAALGLPLELHPEAKQLITQRIITIGCHSRCEAYITWAEELKAQNSITIKAHEKAQLLYTDRMARQRSCREHNCSNGIVTSKLS